MTDAELKRALVSAREELARALAVGDYESLPELVSTRTPLLAELASRAQQSEATKAWAKDYVKHDQRIVNGANDAKETVTLKLIKVRTRKTAQNAYLRTDLWG